MLIKQWEQYIVFSKSCLGMIIGSEACDNAGQKGSRETELWFLQ